MPKSSAVTIEVLTKGAEDIVTLAGPSLPFKGAPWAGKQSIPTTWYPGNPVATQQILGPQEMPSDWEGVWRRTLMGKQPSSFTSKDGSAKPIYTPYALMTVLETIFRAGHRLRVTWLSAAGSQSVRITRVGRAEEWSFPVETADDIRWRIKFTWTGRTGAEVPRVATVRKSGHSEIVEVLDQQANAIAVIKDKHFTPSQPDTPFGIRNKSKLAAKKLTLGQLESIAEAPSELLKGMTRGIQQRVSDLKRIAQIGDTLRRTPLQIANQVLDLVRNTASIAAQYRREISREPAELHTLQRNVDDVIRASRAVSDSHVEATKVVRSALDYEASSDNQNSRSPGTPTMRGRRSHNQSRDILGIHVVRAGDTPQSVSLKWYGSSDNYFAILKANHLSPITSQLVKGRSLVIPQLVGQPQGT